MVQKIYRNANLTIIAATATIAESDLPDMPWNSTCLAIVQNDKRAEIDDYAS